MNTIEELLGGEELTGVTLDTEQKENTNPEIIKFQTGDIIIGRFLPNVNDRSNPWIEYTQCGIQSQSNGSFIDCGLLRKSKKLSDPIIDLRQKLWNKYVETKDEHFKEARNFIKVIPKVVFNWFTISHKNEKVEKFKEEYNQNRVLRLPANRNWQTREITSLIYAQFMKNYKGDSNTDKLGNVLFDLSEKGISYKIKITSKGDYISYDPSGCGFESMQKRIKGLEDWKEPYHKVYDLTKYVPQVKSEEEINNTINLHLTDIVNSLSSNKKIFNFNNNKIVNDGDDDFIPMGNHENLNEPTKKNIRSMVEEDEDDDLELLEKLSRSRKTSV
jgi:hypothetical protein